MSEEKREITTSPRDSEPASSREFSVCALLTAIAFSLLVLAYQAGLRSALNSYIGEHAGGQFLNGVCVVASERLTGTGKYVCLSSVASIMESVGLAASGPDWPSFLANPSFVDDALKKLFTHAPWTVPANTSGPPYDGITGIGWGMDNGYADFISIAFRLFGTRVGALYDAYWLVLAISCLLFAVAHRRAVAPLSVLAAAAGVQYMVFSTDLFWSLNQEWVAMHGARIHDSVTPRFLSSLCIIPALHFLFSAFDSSKTSMGKREVAILILQALVLLLALQQRATVFWVLIAAIILAVLHVLLLRLSRKDDANGKRKQTTFLVLAGMIILGKAYVAITTHPGLNARGYMASHTLWGSIFYAMQGHPDWKSRYGEEFQNQSGDSVAYLAWNRYVASHPAEQNKETTHQFIERMTRKAMIEFAKHDPGFVSSVYLIYNPASIYVVGETRARTMFRETGWAFAFGLLCLGLVLGKVIGRQSSRNLIAATGLVALLCIVSCVPSWATVVMTTSLTDFLILLPIVMILVPLALGAAIAMIAHRPCS